MNKHAACALSIALLFAAAPSFGAKEPKAVITGDQMQMDHGGKLVTFSGDAKVTREKSILKADTLVQDKDTNTVEASGNIDFKSYTTDNELVEATSQKARYDAVHGTGKLWEGKPHVIYHIKSSTSPVHLFADTIDFDQKQEQIRCTGNVEILSSSASVYAASALFLQKHKKAVFTGKPQPKIVYRQEDQKGTYTADTITMLLDRKILLLDGAVHGKMYMKNLSK